MVQNMETLIERIKRHEGLRLRPYRDSLGNASIGYGHFLRIPISQNAAVTILRDDVMRAYLDFSQLSDAITIGLTEKRQEVLVEMIFNLGFNGVRNFKRMMGALTSRDYNRAADEMLDSLWAKQVKSRAIELADMMREG